MATDDYAADARIAAKIQTGNFDTEVEAWVRRFARKAMTYALKWGHYQDAEDYVQDFLVWLHQNRLRTFMGGQSLTGYCFKVFVHLLYRAGQEEADRRRRFDTIGLPGEDGLGVQPIAPDASPEEKMALREPLEKALGGLRQRDADVIIDYYLEEIPIDELARRLGISVGATKVRIHRAKGSLKNALQRGWGSTGHA